MLISSIALQAHIKDRDLLSLRRAAIDDRLIQGFVLECSKSLLLLQHVYDFHVDGYMVIRQEDITELKVSDTDRFQRQLLVSEGTLDRIDFSFRAPIQSFDAFLSSRASDEIVIVEDEISEPNQFFIGTISRVLNGTAIIRHFNGVAHIIEPPEDISTERITSCKTRTNYIQFYQWYFERIMQCH